MLTELTFLLIIIFLLFNIGFIGILINRTNVLMILISIEILILAINLFFATLSIYLDDIVGQIFVIFVLTIAAAESTIGLSFITSLYKLKNKIQLIAIKKKLFKI